MLSIDFENYRKSYPSLAKALDALRDYLAAKEHRRLKHIDPLRVLHNHPDLSALELEFALSFLADNGLLQPGFAVLAPDGAQAMGGYYKSPKDVPEVLTSLSFEEFPKADGVLVPVYLEVGKP